MPRLLLADDSTAIQRLVELTFSQEDIHVTAVGDGEQAIASIAANPPDVVLADIGMPKRSGYEVAAYVKDQPRLAKIPVLLLAGAFEPVDEARALQVRCDGVLVKPFEPQQMITRVRELLSGAPVITARTAHGVPRPIERLTAPRAIEQAPRPVDGALDSYFDRLDAAFSTFETSALASRDEPEKPIEALPAGADFDLDSPLEGSLNQLLSDPDADFDIPTIDRVLGITPPAPRDADGDEANAGPRPAPQVHRPAADSPFARRECANQATDASRQPDPGSASASAIADAFSALLAAEEGDPVVQPIRLGAAAQPALTDTMIEELTRRVLERLSSEALRPIVADIVSAVSERLVREEIDRIRRQ